MDFEIKPREALIYTRVATMRQSTGSAELDDQFSRCEQYAEKLGFEVKATFSDGCRSGTASTWGPGMLSLLRYVHDHRPVRFVIVVANAARLTRDIDRYFTLQRKLKAAGAEIHTVPLR